jgi:hypothetical protein
MGRLDAASLAIVVRIQVRRRLHDEFDDDPRRVGLVVDAKRTQAPCTREVEDSGMIARKFQAAAARLRDLLPLEYNLMLRSFII